MIAIAGYWLAYTAILEWHLGWVARVIGFVLFSTAPGVIAIVVANFRSEHNLVAMNARLAIAGMSLLILGALEFVLAIASWLLYAVFGNAFY